MSALTGYNKFIQQALKYGFSLWGIPKTGQTIKYADGDDGDYQKGYPRQGPRFTDNGDGTITDNATGLMWVKDGTGAGCNNGNDRVWATQLAFAEGLTFAGYSDWRLPNLKEQISIVDYGRSNPALDPVFINFFSAPYWSSTTLTLNTANAWLTSYYNGFPSNLLKDIPMRVHPVRAGQ